MQSPPQLVLSDGLVAADAASVPARVDYLAVASVEEGARPLCSNAEGWGPLSSLRYDFTPCFLDVWVAGVAVIFGLVLGTGALVYLLRRKSVAPVKKDWHFYAKLVVVSAFGLTTALQACLQIEAMPGFWFADFRFWSSVATLCSVGVVGTVHYYEHWRSRQPSGVVLFYWLLMCVAQAVKLRSLVARGAFNTPGELPYAATFAVSTGLAVVQFVLDEFVSKRRPDYAAVDADVDEDECPIIYADVFSLLTFGWMTPLMRYGYQHYLTMEDLWSLRKRDRTGSCGRTLQAAWDRQTKRKSLWVAMANAFGGPYVRGAIIKSVSDVLQYAQPQLLRMLIDWVGSHRTPNPQPTARGVAIALSMFVISVTQTSFLNQYFQRAFETGMRIRAGLTSMIYAKSLKLSNEGKSAQTTGDIVNRMAIDAQRLQDLTQFGQQIWSAPFQITLCMVSLYQLVGYSMFAGVGIMILAIPLNGFVARMQRNLQKRQMKNKDSRTRLMTEILNNMKSIKLYAWGRAFMRKLTYIRNDLELSTLRKIGALAAVQNFTWSSTPVLVSTATFAVFTAVQKQPLSVDLVFPALALFNLLSFPLMILPMVITAIVEATVAVSRLTDFLSADELQDDAVISRDAVQRDGEVSVRVSGAAFSWDRYGEGRCLDNIDFVAKKGELSCIVGRVGCGKTSLLEGILGNVYKVKGEIVVHGKTAYAAQQPWIMNASLKENITFGHRWDPQFYEKTIWACALEDDLKVLPDGDQTEVGERGIQLSGGQKARLALARAVYARADVYLLDDILSAVDQHVGRHIINNVLGPKGLLASRTRILATNAIPVLEDSNFISLIREGAIIEKGTYEQLMAVKGEVANLVKTHTKESGSATPTEDASSASATQPTPAELPPDQQQEQPQLVQLDADQYSTDSDDEEVQEAQEEIAQLIPIKSRASGATRRASSQILRRASTVSFKESRRELLDAAETGKLKSQQTKENMEHGKVKWDVYKEYAKANNLVAVSIYLVALLGGQTLQVGSNLWLKHWAEMNQDFGGSSDVWTNIGIYFAFGIGGSLLMVVQTLIQWIFCSIEASRKLHERMAFAVFRSPMSFFETNPLGRIVNRFSSDVYRVDEVLARTFNMLFVNGSKAMYTLAIITASTPIFAVLILPIGGLYFYFQRFYLRTSRELKRLDSVSKSPIYAHFQETLGGLTTIRAYRQQERFSMENEWHVDGNLKTLFPSFTANRWLAVRLEFIGSLIILAAAAFGIISTSIGGGPSSGMIGLAMSYALQITQSLNWIVRQTVEVETNIVSVERCLEYARLPPEAPEVLEHHRPKSNWPSNGAIEFKNYSTRYRPGLDLVLKNIDLKIKAHERVGVVGRTGAGKTSLTLSLFRVIEPTAGSIEIDDLNTSSIGLLDLRKRLAIIPQDAALFAGTVRDNLDPAHLRDDSELWDALTHARLRDHIRQMPGQLEAQIHEGGSNLSQGQRQLVSLARALLTPTSILVLDEATAAVDIETDELLQDTLRSNIFRDRTIITIAHRINTILDSDRIVVLSAGNVVEFDKPAELVRRKGLFYELVREAGLLDYFST